MPTIREPTAMALATHSASRDRHRIVLLKDFSDAGFTFYTNYGSPKGLDLRRTATRFGILLDSARKQVRISGRVKRPLAK